MGLSVASAPRAALYLLSPKGNSEWSEQLSYFVFDSYSPERCFAEGPCDCGKLANIPERSRG